MSLQKAEEFYRSLTQSQQHLIDKKTLNDTQKVQQWLKFLSRAADYDEYTDKMVEQYKKRKNGFYIAGAISAFLGLFALVAGFPFIIILAPIFFVLGAIPGRKMKRLQAHDLHNSLRELFVPLLQVLMAKAGPETKLVAKLDFNDPRSGEANSYKDGRGRKVKRYDAVYVICKVGLQDGALLELVVGDSLFDISYWKTSASGKRKHKTKSKTNTQVIVKLTAPKAVYDRTATLQGDPNEVSVEDKGDAWVVKSKRKYKFVGTNILGAKPVLKLLSAVYAELVRKDGGEAMVAAEGQKPPLPPDVWQREYFDEYDVWGTTMIMDSYYLDDDDHTNIFDS